MNSEEPGLTKRESEVLLLAAQGLRSAEIARRLGISPRTAEHHRSRIYEKLDLSGIAELVRYAFDRGLIEPRGRRDRSRSGREER